MPMSMPTLSLKGTAGLVFTLILSMDKRDILPQSEFITDLGEVVQAMKATGFLSQQVAEELSAVHSYLQDRQGPTH
jgi:hypothetical protein